MTIKDYRLLAGKTLTDVEMETGILLQKLILIEEGILSPNHNELEKLHVAIGCNKIYDMEFNDSKLDVPLDELNKFQPLITQLNKLNVKLPNSYQNVIIEALTFIVRDINSSGHIFFDSLKEVMDTSDPRSKNELANILNMKILSDLSYRKEKISNYTSPYMDNSMALYSLPVYVNGKSNTLVWAEIYLYEKSDIKYILLVRSMDGLLRGIKKKDIIKSVNQAIEMPYDSSLDYNDTICLYEELPKKYYKLDNEGNSMSFDEDIESLLAFNNEYKYRSYCALIDAKDKLVPEPKLNCSNTCPLLRNRIPEKECDKCVCHGSYPYKDNYCGFDYKLVKGLRVINLAIQGISDEELKKYDLLSDLWYKYNLDAKFLELCKTYDVDKYYIIQNFLHYEQLPENIRFNGKYSVDYINKSRQNAIIKVAKILDYKVPIKITTDEVLDLYLIDKYYTHIERHVKSLSPYLRGE